MSEQNVLKSAALLTLSGIIAKTVDFVFRAYYSRCLGSEGMGIFSLVFSFHAIMLNISAGGFSVAVSKIVSEKRTRGDYTGAKKTVAVSALCIMLLSLFVIFFTYIYSDKIAYVFLKEPRCRRCIVFLSPSILFMGISYCIKGYFYAMRRVIIPASSEFLEQAVKISVISFLLRLWLPRGIQHGCEAVFLGLSIGEFASCLYLTVFCAVSLAKLPETRPQFSSRSVLPQIAGAALPIMLSSLLGSLMRMQEDVLIVSGLRKHGFSQQSSLNTYGTIHGMIMPLTVFPLTLMSSVLTLLVPEISRANSMRSRERLKALTERIFRFTAFFAFLTLAVFETFSKELSAAVYNAPETSGILSVLALICPLMFFDSVSCGILNGLGKQGSLLLFNLSDSALRLFLISFLIPKLGTAALIGIIITSNVFTSALTVSRVLKHTKINFNASAYFIKPLMSSAAACFAAQLIPDVPALSGNARLAAAMLIFAAVYAAISVLFGAFRRSDLKWLASRGF